MAPGAWWDFRRDKDGAAAGRPPLSREDVIAKVVATDFIYVKGVPMRLIGPKISTAVNAREARMRSRRLGAQSGRDAKTENIAKGC